MKPILVSVVALLLTACQQSGPAYQADRDISDRDTYQGVDGLVQYQKDQDALRQREREAACLQSKIALQKASSEQHAEQIASLEAQVKSQCAGTRSQSGE